MPTLTYYGSSVADATLTTACGMATTTGGSETSAQTILLLTNVFGEVWSKGNAGLNTVTAIPATPTGNGWIAYPGAGTFATGNWSAVFTFAHVASTTSDCTIRFFRLVSGTYTSIGTINTATNTAAKTTYTFAATSMATITFNNPTDGLYTDLWYHDSNANAGGDNPTVYESNSSSIGVVNDMQITTSTFTASGGSSHVIRGDGYGGVFS